MQTHTHTHLSLLIETGQIRDIGGVRVKVWVRRFQVVDKHAELRPPIAHVVDPVNFVSEKFKSAAEGLADDG